jgi:hypothetical protein
MADAGWNPRKHPSQTRTAAAPNPGLWKTCGRDVEGLCTNGQDTIIFLIVGRN